MLVKYPLYKYLEQTDPLMLQYCHSSDCHTSMRGAGADCFLPPGPAVITIFKDWFSQLSLSILPTGNLTDDSILLYNSWAQKKRTVKHYYIYSSIILFTAYLQKLKGSNDLMSL